MPRVRPRRGERTEPFQSVERVEFTEAICVEGYSHGWTDPVRRGAIYSAEHWQVRTHPEFWRLLGPRPDVEGVSNGG
jgi:hypothetical protein